MHRGLRWAKMYDLKDKEAGKQVVAYICKIGVTRRRYKITHEVAEQNKCEQQVIRTK